MDIVFGQLHLLMLGTELEAVPADTVSFELCIYSYLRASCVHSDRVCRLYSFIINVLLLFECRWSHSLQILLHVRNTWTSIFLASLEVDGFDGDIKSRVLRAIHDGPNGLKSKDFSDQKAEIECPEQVVRKDEEPMEIDSVINDIQNKLCL